MVQLKSASFKDYFNLLTLAAIWGTAFIGIEFALEKLAILHITFGRVFIASLILLPFALFKKWKSPISIITWFYIVLAAILNTTIPFSLINYGQQTITSGMSALMLGFGPFITLILAHFLTTDEKFSMKKLYGILLGLIGLVILLGSSVLVLDIAKLEGQLSVLGASFCYVLSSIVVRKIKGLTFYHLSFLLFIFATISLLPFIFQYPFIVENIYDHSLIALVYLGVFPTAIASLYRIQIVQTVGVQFMSQVSYLIPLFALIWAWLILDERPEISTYIAFCFIMFGLYLREK